jgi:hypothetical protein
MKVRLGFMVRGQTPEQAVDRLADWSADVPLGNPAQCAALVTQIQGLENEIATLQKELGGAPTNEKSQIIEQIVKDEKELGTLKSEQAASGCPAAHRFLSLTIPQQEQSNWCWVAVGSGINSFYDDTTYPQCSVVTMVFRVIHPGYTPDCCLPQSDPSQLPCNGESGADQALSYPKRHFLRNTSPLDWEDLNAQIDSGAPVAAGISWSDGGSHFVALTGYAVSATTPPVYSIYVQDPATGPSWWTFDSFTSGYDQVGSWSSSTLSTPAITTP